MASPAMSTTQAPSRMTRDDAENHITVSIRRATVCDLDEIITIWIDGQKDASECEATTTREQVAEFYAAFLDSENARFGIWVAELSSAPNGSVILGWQSLLPCRPHPSFQQLWATSSTYIGRDKRARGIGRTLLTFVSAAAPDLGLSHIIGYIRSDNVPAARIVESLGWKCVGTIPPAGQQEHELFCYAYAVPSASR